MAVGWDAHNGGVRRGRFERDWTRCHALPEAAWAPVLRWMYLYFVVAALGLTAFVGQRK